MFTVLTNKKIAQNVYEMTLAGDTSGIKNAGQFVNVKIDGLFLRRPISVCDYGENFLKIIYKVVGRGTEKMSAMSAGQPLDILTGLGNGYDLSAAGDKPLLIGGGVGVPPLYNLAKKLLAAGKKVSVILGFNTESEIFYEEEFRALGADVTVATAGHPIEPGLRRQAIQYNADVRIGSNVWVGAGAVILPGVTIGDDTVIGAGSVVTKDIPAGVVAVPCAASHRPAGQGDLLPGPEDRRAAGIAVRGIRHRRESMSKWKRNI